MVVRRRHELELREDARDVRFDRLRRKEWTLADRLVRATLRHQCQDVALPLREIVERHRGAPPADELSNDFRIDDGAAARDPPDGIGEIVKVLDAVLEEIADAPGTIADEAQCIGRLGVL